MSLAARFNILIMALIAFTAAGVGGFSVRQIDVEGHAALERHGRQLTQMVARTSTELAPWTIVAANDKRSARITFLETVCQRLGDALKGRKKKRRR